MNLLVSKTAPFFSSNAFIPATNSFKNISLTSFQNKYVYMLFYPLNFTFVCPTEIHALSNLYDKFLEKNCELVTVSVDSVYSHQAFWNLDTSKGGLGKRTKVPMLSDLSGTIAQSFGVFDYDKKISVRGGFLIDSNGVIRHAGINDLGVGRNFEEVLRMVEGFQYCDTNGEVCPAGWKQAGDPTMKGGHEFQETQNYWNKVLGK